MKIQDRGDLMCTSDEKTGFLISPCFGAMRTGRNAIPNHQGKAEDWGNWVRKKKIRGPFALEVTPI